MPHCRRDDTPQCEGKSRRSGERCELAVEPGSKYCRFHGGRLPKGPMSHFYKHGRYSKHVPERMQEDMARIAADKDLLGLTDELVLLKARAQDVLRKVDTGESGKAWKELKIQARAYKQAVRRGDQVAEVEALTEMLHLIDHGSNDTEAWDDVRSVIRDVTKLAESQRRYQLEQHHMVSVETAYNLMSALVEVVRRTVVDEHTRDLIAEEFGRLANSQLHREPAIEAEVHAA